MVKKQVDSGETLCFWFLANQKIDFPVFEQLNVTVYQVVANNFWRFA
jgi:hypothetical protein